MTVFWVKKDRKDILSTFKHVIFLWMRIFMFILCPSSCHFFHALVFESWWKIRCNYTGDRGSAKVTIRDVLWNTIISCIASKNIWLVYMSWIVAFEEVKTVCRLRAANEYACKVASGSGHVSSSARMPPQCWSIASLSQPLHCRFRCIAYISWVHSGCNFPWLLNWPGVSSA